MRTRHVSVTARHCYVYTLQSLDQNKSLLKRKITKAIITIIYWLTKDFRFYWRYFDLGLFTRFTWLASKNAIDMTPRVWVLLVYTGNHPWTKISCHQIILVLDKKLKKGHQQKKAGLVFHLSGQWSFLTLTVTVTITLILIILVAIILKITKIKQYDTVENNDNNNTTGFMRL